MIFVGDLHGDFKKLRHKVCYYYNKNYIQLGDFGVGFSEHDYDMLSELNFDLVNNESKLYVIRGNHDDPSFWGGSIKYSNIVFVKDNSILELEGHSILCIGGGISIDRVRREANVSYWLNEHIDYDILLDKEFDILCTHVPYRDIYPGFENTSSIVGFYSEFDKTLLLDLEEENKFFKYVNEYIKTIKCKYWFSGHFHKSRYVKKDGIKYNSLNINEFMEV